MDLLWWYHWGLCTITWPWERDKERLKEQREKTKFTEKYLKKRPTEGCSEICHKKKDITLLERCNDLQGLITVNKNEITELEDGENAKT